MPRARRAVCAVLLGTAPATLWGGRLWWLWRGHAAALVALTACSNAAVTRYALAKMKVGHRIRAGPDAAHGSRGERGDTEPCGHGQGGHAPRGCRSSATVHGPRGTVRGARALRLWGPTDARQASQPWRCTRPAERLARLSRR